MVSLLPQNMISQSYMPHPRQARIYSDMCGRSIIQDGVAVAVLCVNHIRRPTQNQPTDQCT